MLTPTERHEIYSGVIEDLMAEFELLDTQAPTPALVEDNDQKFGTHWEVPSLEDMILGLQPLPPFTTVLGQCEDGLPLLFDFLDPAPGSILIEAADPNSSLLFLENFIRATAILNRPADLHYFLIGKSDEFESILTQHCQLYSQPTETDSESIVYALTEIAERRRIGQGRGPVQCLLIENLDDYLSYCNQETWIHLKWLIRHGAKQGIWVLAANRQRSQFPDIQRLVKEFHTVIFSEADQNNQWRNPTGTQGPVNPLNQFTFRFGSEWIRFVIPA